MFKYFISVIIVLYISYIINIFNNYKLEKVLIISRHGAREPIIYSNKMKLDYWQNIDSNNLLYNSDLTKLAEYNTYLLGKKFIRRYNFIKNLDKENIGIFSSSFNRTIKTAYNFNKGLNKNLTKINVVNFLNSDMILNSSQNNNYDKYNKNFKINFINPNKLIDLNNYIFNLTNFKINHDIFYVELFNTVSTYKYHNYLFLENFENNYKMENLYNTLKKITFLFYNDLHNLNEYNIEHKYLGEVVYNKIMYFLHKSNYKYIYLSTHDNILMPLLKYISKNNYTNYVFPEFNSNIVFELWVNNNIKYINIYYNNNFIDKILYVN